MSRLVAGLAAAALLASPAAVDAQVNRNIIRDSGNGVNNTVTVRNGPGPIRLFAPGPVAGVQPGFNGGFDPSYGAGFQPGFQPGFGGGFQPGFAGYGPQAGGFQPGYGGPGFPFGPGGFGVNVNVITNSGNGAGNTIGAFNRSWGGPGGININVITNSGNGVGNTIGIKNR